MAEEEQPIQEEVEKTLSPEEKAQLIKAIQREKKIQILAFKTPPLFKLLHFSLIKIQNLPSLSRTIS